MKLFLDDFNVFNNMIIQLPKLWLCFDKHWKFNINLNPIFLVYWWVILDYIVSKKR
jgi:hypothetical protein